MGMVVKQPYSLVSKLKEQDKIPTLYWLPKLHKTHIKQDLLLILVLVRQPNLVFALSPFYIVIYMFYEMMHG